MSAQANVPDMWSDWLLNRRYGGGTVAHRGRLLKTVEQMRDRVLDNTQLSAGMSLMDVGAGDGLIGFGAIGRWGGDLKVTFVDISQSLLGHARELAVRMGVESQCDFIQASADALAGVQENHFNAVTTRSSLAYVVDKATAFGEFYRVLKPAGRISIAEPINQEFSLETCAMGRMLLAENMPEKTRESVALLHRFRSAIYPATEEEIRDNPMTNYNERDLVRLARQAGFAEVHLELHIDLRADFGAGWDVFMETSPHPGAPTPRVLFQTHFSESERKILEQQMRPAVEMGESIVVSHMAYLTAIKPVKPRMMTSV